MISAGLAEATLVSRSLGDAVCGDSDNGALALSLAADTDGLCEVLRAATGDFDGAGADTAAGSGGAAGSADAAGCDGAPLTGNASPSGSLPRTMIVLMGRGSVLAQVPLPGAAPAVAIWVAGIELGGT